MTVLERLQPLLWSPLVSEWALRSLLRLLTDSSAALQWFLQRLSPFRFVTPAPVAHQPPTWEIIPRLTAHLGKKKNPKPSPLSLSVANSQRANPRGRFLRTDCGDDAAAASLLSLPDTPCDTDPWLSLQSLALTIRSAAVICACFNVTKGRMFWETLTF